MITISYSSLSWRWFNANMHGFIFNNFQRTSSVSTMLNHLQWPSLQERCAQYKVVMAYRCVNNLVDIPLTYYQAAPVATLRRHTQKYMYVIPFARTLAFQRSFFPDSIGLWNLLPQETVQLSVSFDEMCSTYNSTTNGRRCFLLAPAMHVV